MKPARGQTLDQTSKEALHLFQKQLNVKILSLSHVFLLNLEDDNPSLAIRSNPWNNFFRYLNPYIFVTKQVDRNMLGILSVGVLCEILGKMSCLKFQRFTEFAASLEIKSKTQITMNLCEFLILTLTLCTATVFCIYSEDRSLPRLEGKKKTTHQTKTQKAQIQKFVS